MLPNFLILGASAFIPIVIWLLWSKLFLKTKLDILEGGISKPFKLYHWGLFFILNFLLAIGVYAVTVHQAHVLSLTGPDIDVFKNGTSAAFMDEFGRNFQNINHGIAHGVGVGYLFFALPLIGILAIFENKGLRYFLIYSAYWIISLGLMGAIIGKWGGVLV